MPQAINSRNALILLVALASVLIYWFYGSQYFFKELVDDEPYYYEQIARFNTILTHLFSGDWGRIPPVWDRIVGNGWFIPAVSLFLSPFWYFVQEPGHFRVILFLANLGLHCYILYTLARLFGLKVMLIFHSASLLFPIYPVFMGAIVGEGLASRLALILLLQLYEISRARELMRFRDAIGVGVLLVLVVYFRQNLIVLCPAVIAVQLLDHFGKCQRLDLPGITSALTRSAVITLTFLILFLPWSYGLSKKFGGPYLTTTSIQVGYIWKFATPDFERERFPDGRHPNQFHGWMKYYLTLSQQTGESFYDLVARDKAALKPAVPPQAEKNYLQNRAKRNFLKPNSFVERYYFGGIGTKGSKGSEPPNSYKSLAFLNTYVGFGILVLGACFLFIIPPPDWEGTHLTLSTRLFILALTASFLAVGAHHRHLAMLYPLLMLLIAVTAGTGCRLFALKKGYTAYEMTLIGVQAMVPLLLIVQILLLFK